MERPKGSPRILSLNMNQMYAAQTVANETLKRPSTSGSGTPISSTPATPSLSTPNARRPSHPATSPLTQHSPNPAKTIRRASSTMSLDQRSTSSPKLVRKSSRTSLGAQIEENEKRPTPKRSISNLISGLRDAQSKMESIEEPVPLTAPQIAIEHFTRELIAHGQPDSSAETVVILHDACYGHRYSRLKTTKSTLSMIVERPERIHASILGASTAYVRLGGHHAGARNAPHPDINEPSPPPFKIRRTGRSMDITSPYVTNVHGTAWMSELRNMCDVAGEKIAAGAKELSRSATPTEPEKRKLHEGDLYLSAESLNAFQGALGGVADAVDTVFASGSPTKRAFVAIRPPGHHCSANHPSGFCWLNNVHVGIEYAAQTYGLTHAAILDFDLHHGDGSQAITWQRNSKNNEQRLNAKPNSKRKLGPDIGYYSLHDINSYPCEMGDDEKVQAASLCIDNAHGQSVWNAHLQPWKNEDDFWHLYETQYRILLEKARGFLRHHTARLRADGKVAPKSAVFISAGFDASEWEGAGMQRHKVNVPTEFYARFTRDVVQLAQEEGLGCDGRVISVLEGGYSDRALCSGVLSHLSGLCAMPVESKRSATTTTMELDQMMRGLGISEVARAEDLRYDKSWWSAASLTALELQVNPPPPAQAKKMRLGPQKTYATPTESFAYKVVDTDKFARSISGTMREVARPARPPTPPPPEVDWIVATQELSKLLIPSDRQTRSCTPDELAVRTKKDRMSAMPILTTAEPAEPRQLRDRKAKGPVYPESAHSDELESMRSVSRSSRRQTVADFSTLEQLEPQHQRRASRRLSAGSTLSSLVGELAPTPPPVPAIPAATTTTTNSKMKPPPAPQPAAQVKRTRVPAAVKSKKEIVSSAPASPARTKKAPASAVATSNGVVAPTKTDVDALTSGMKKITLKVGSKEEHDRKQKEKVDAERKARALKAAETRKANTAARKAAQSSSVQVAKSGSDQPLPAATENTAPSPALSSELAFQPLTQATASTQTPATLAEPEFTEWSHSHAELPIQDLHSPTAVTHEIVIPETQTQYPAQQPAQFQFDDETYLPTNHTSAYEDQSPHIIAMRHLGPPLPDSAARQFNEEKKLTNGTSALPLGSASSPIRPLSRDRLPVWNSTGPIPFAPNPGNAAPSKTAFDNGPAFGLNAGMNDMSTRNGMSDSVDGSKPTITRTDALEDTSVWDVPETP